MTTLLLPGAACNDPDERDKFDAVNIDHRATERAINAAKAVCRRCPATAACLEWGLHHEDRGVWAGHSAAELRKMRQRDGIVLAEPDGAGHARRGAAK